MSLNFDINTLNRDKNGSFTYMNSDGHKVLIEEHFPITEWDCPEAFKSAGIRGYEPMTAKELETEEQQDKALNDQSNIIEEKFDGTRALVYFLSQDCIESGEVVDSVGFCRVFSRRVSKRTGFYVENTDSLPQIAENDSPELAGTVLDGEMFIEGLPFKDVSSTLNCLWDKAIDRQIEKGFISFHAFDILFYKGIDLRKMPLERRKVYLRLAVEEANNPYIKEVDYYDINTLRDCSFYSMVMKRINMMDEDPYFDMLEDEKENYPNLYQCWKENSALTPRAYYELIVSTGGEGVIVKPKSGKYLHKRGWEYSKIKKFMTRELIVVGFSEPTKEYTGKDIRKWGFWVHKDTGKRVQGNFYGDKNYIPVTRFYYYNQVGNLLLGVLLTEKEYDKIPKNKRGALYTPSYAGIYHHDELLIMEVCECSGFDDDTREYFTRNQDNLIGSVVEVKANEVFKDSGKLRHPRFLRRRFDKAPETCVWSDHINS